jgi:hypothetical protein
MHRDHGQFADRLRFGAERADAAPIQARTSFGTRCGNKTGWCAPYEKGRQPTDCDRATIARGAKGWKRPII